MIKKIVKLLLQKFGKRITNYYAPAKPYEEGVLFLKSIIKKPDWIIDVGVAYGTPEIYQAFSFTEYKYLLIEADPRFKAKLEKLKLKHPKNIIFENCFCGESDNVINFNLNNNGRSSSRYSDKGNSEVIKVPMHTLDSISRKYNIKSSILLKIDVEGAEIDVLRGATETLKNCDVIILESWINPGRGVKTQSTFDQVIDFMSRNGFVVFDFFGGHSYKTGVLKMVDLVFVRQDSPYRVMQNLE